uniref:Uncharacterized protein n=1 Tax=Aplanochytrium stocchinoi TaxID=215587 RepID=A0A6S8AHG1_9STRA|mmetsp:Transcript_17635/g.21712  ORF Transcript_17635/g.21712 Transcript_17635/m.21712 type:complete len:199 (-) Transcript_17635:471-1067(-)|eukprot:CAMPEP_0204831970 /NCGR_PEP_ID=MMETSP1346-20131115/12261_1 /ASSEMBLY_ACC=CAM_ASM_000771 /TAXON_ID=215587 /ORGANISM="Aplanochytrium stocchinoi, Strain GSBS06" /LENGTH=198 /DNA_ID=CAMNT_0051963447 /DNA_START=217 /DNA_END=813 /DNA_ORIENTATION=-
MTTKEETKKWKDNIPVVGFGISCGINMMMITTCLFDYSVDLYVVNEEGFEPSRLLFLGEYYRWRGSAPVLGTVLSAILLPLPFVLFGMIRDCLRSVFGWEQATLLRHIADIGTVCTLLGCILPMVITKVIPAQDDVIEQCTEEHVYGVRENCATAAKELPQQHLVMLILNIAMLGWDVAKYIGNRREIEAVSNSKKVE